MIKKYWVNCITREVLTAEEFTDRANKYIDGLLDNYADYLRNYIETNCSKMELWGALHFETLEEIQDYLKEVKAEAEANFVAEAREKLYSTYKEINIEV